MSNGTQKEHEIIFNNDEKSYELRISKIAKTEHRNDIT
jgi:hypothetical protein